MKQKKDYNQAYKARLDAHEMKVVYLVLPKKDEPEFKKLAKNRRLRHLKELNNGQ